MNPPKVLKTVTRVFCDRRGNDDIHTPLLFKHRLFCCCRSQGGNWARTWRWPAGSWRTGIFSHSDTLKGTVSRDSNQKNIQSEKKYKKMFEHLWEVESIYIYIFFFKCTLRCQQSDSGPIICRRCRWYRWCTLTCKYLREFLGERCFLKKTRSKKSRDTVPSREFEGPPMQKSAFWNRINSWNNK